MAQHKLYTVWWIDPTGQTTKDVWTSEHMFVSLAAVEKWTQHSANKYKVAIAIDGPDGRVTNVKVDN